MSEVIKFPGVRYTKAEDKPDADCVRYDDAGKPLYLYLLSYDMNGPWSTQVWAYSFEDAQARVDAMRSSLVVLGQAFGSVPA